MTTTNQDKLTQILNNVFPDIQWDDSVEDTARRILKFWKEFNGQTQIRMDGMTQFAGHAYNDQIILVSDIEFSSVCAHHLLPFWGKAHVAYIPDQRIIGLSKIPRLVDAFSNRPQTQENLTKQIGDYLNEIVRPQGVAVVIKSKHTCMACRGVRKHNGWMTTSKMLGVFLKEHEPRAEFFNLLKGNTP